MKKYVSKIDWWFILLVLVVLGYPLIDGLIHQDWGLCVAMVFFFMFFYFLGRSLHYTIKEDQLKIWFLKPIPISSINRIYKTKNPLSAPALSLDRIAIVYNKYDEILISPKDREDFIKTLLAINPEIKVEV